VICCNDEICIAELRSIGFSILAMVFNGLQCTTNLVMKVSRDVSKDLCRARLLDTYLSISCTHSLIITMILRLVNLN
jgi:hypothetical protein